MVVYICVMKESFKIDSNIKKRLGIQAKLTGRTMTGLAELILDKQLTAMEKAETVYDGSYAYVMAPVLGDAIKKSNKKKK